MFPLNLLRRVVPQQELQKESFVFQRLRKVLDHSSRGREEHEIEQRGNQGKSKKTNLIGFHNLPRRRAITDISQKARGW